MSTSDADFEKSLYPATLPTEPVCDNDEVKGIAKKIVDAVATAAPNSDVVFGFAGGAATLSAAKKAAAVFNNNDFAWKADVTTYPLHNKPHVGIYLHRVGPST
jgi:hypothetical protein